LDLLLGRKLYETLIAKMKLNGVPYNDNDHKLLTMMFLNDDLISGITSFAGRVANTIKPWIKPVLETVAP
jgi:hypothetical protein